MVKKKKIFPKLKKKLKGFLTDESGKISKKDALGLAAGAVLLSGVESASAVVDQASTCTGTPSVGHASGITNGSYYIPVSATLSPDACPTGSNLNGTSTVTDTPACTVTVNPVSGAIHGHYSSPGTVSSIVASGHCSHGSHGSHGSHAAGGWC